MNLIPELNFYIKTFSVNKQFNIILLNILFNKRNIFIINKTILEHLEKEIDKANLEYFRAFIKEIYDETRYLKEDSLTVKNYKSDVLNFYLNSNINFIIPIKSNINSEFKREEFNNLLDLTDLEDQNYNSLLSSILCKGLISYNYSDFNNNSNIDDLFKNLFKIPNKIDLVYCFNRDYSHRFLEMLANKRMFYYSLVSRDFPRNIHEYNEKKKELRKKLGNRLDIYVTKKRTLIHERKIFINGLSITFDNAFDNILIEEPTWEITIEYSEEKFNTWIKKRTSFNKLN